jgi:hypothetical protein
VSVHTVIRSSDTADIRAMRIMEHAGIDVGDPKLLARHRKRIAEMVEQYRALDEQATR